MENEIFQSNMESSNLDDYFLQKKVEIMIESNNKKLTNEVNNLRAIITKLNEELSEIKKQLTQGKLTQKIEPITILKHDEDNKTVNKAKNSEEPLKPRYGNYKPEDVNINKFFYFGNKK